MRRNNRLGATLRALLLIAGLVVCLEGQTAEQYVAVLIPAYAVDAPGAHGSIWRTEIWAHNSADEPVWVSATTRENPCRITCLPPEIQPGQTRRRPVRVGFAFSGGFLYIDRARFEDIDLSVRVLELSRDLDDTGLTIPAVVRDSIAPGRPARIVHVRGGDPRARSMLRIYDLETRGMDVTLRLVDEQSGAVVHESVVAMRALEGTDWIPANAFSDGLPTYAQLRLEDLDLAAEAFFRVEVHPHDPASRVWAMLSYTDVETQRVSLIFPQP